MTPCLSGLQRETDAIIAITRSSNFKKRKPQLAAAPNLAVFPHKLREIVQSGAASELGHMLNVYWRGARRRRRSSSRQRGPEEFLRPQNPVLLKDVNTSEKKNRHASSRVDHHTTNFDQVYEVHNLRFCCLFLLVVARTGLWLSFKLRKLRIDIRFPDPWRACDKCST